MKKIMNRYKPMVLPSNNKVLYEFLESNKINIMESIVDSIEYAVKKNLPMIEVFSFENLEFVITLPSDCFEKNIDCIYDYYIKNEKYELCKRVVKIKDRLKTNEQKKKVQKN